jgi:peptidoglycan/xylan/chitin deacetylase (PgdA/CDA1 family)
MTRYWLRFDDLCPTHSRSRWERVERLLAGHRVAPILAVVPDNADPTLRIDPPDPAFWERARGWQERGWVIGLHGWRHVYDSRAPSLLPFKAVSEFSGHPYDEQHARIGRGLAVLRGHGLEPRVFVAPGHAFDARTLDALAAHGLRAISDGFGFRPVRDERGLVWVPQQTRRPRPFPFGTVTIALHANEMDDDAVARLGAFLDRRRDRLGRDFDGLLAGAAARGAADRLWESILLAAFRWNARRHGRAVEAAT